VITGILPKQDSFQPCGPVVWSVSGITTVNGITQKIGLVAVVDDDDDLREALASLLRAARLTTETYATAESFLNSPRRLEVACLVLDVRLPGMSGIELQKKLVDEGYAYPIVFISAHGDAPVRDIAIKAGASAFLSKPVRSQALLDEINIAVNKSMRKSDR
jgi:two-component system, LuxR family, response regulator FixJ